MRTNAKTRFLFVGNNGGLQILVQSMGGECTDLGIVPDRLDATREGLRTAAQGHDLIITSGGVSVGEEDHIKPAVEAEGKLNMWQIDVWRIP